MSLDVSSYLRMSPDVSKCLEKAHLDRNSYFQNDKVEDLRDMYLILSRIGKDGIEAIKQVKNFNS